VTSDRTIGFVALAGAIVGYGGLWPVTKFAVETLPPLWFATARLGLGALILFGLLKLMGQLKAPTRHDLPLVLSVAIVMMTTYTVLMHLALRFVEAGRAALLGYTTPLWVLPAAYLILGERPSKRRLVGMFLALAGLVLLFNPASFDWQDRDVVTGNLMLLACAISWTFCIIHIRRHTPLRTPFQLAPFQLTIATVLTGLSAFIIEGSPYYQYSDRELALLAYGAVMGTAVAMLSITTCLRYLPTTISTVGLLGVPVFALVLSVLFLGETLTRELALGVVLIIVGIGFVSIPDRRRP
jgi:drug/metabolite transporter (DMT)-like permease